MKIGNKEFDMNSNHTYVMGILNVTPDSFSDGGRFINQDDALEHVDRMIEQGVDIIDVGGESTRPGHQQIPEEEEIERVTEVIACIKDRFDIPVSIDTYKAPVAKAALEAGADVINDIWGLQYDVYNKDSILADRYSGKNMAEVVNAYDVPIILMHNDNLGRDMEGRNDEVITDFLEANSCFESPEQIRTYIVDEEHMIGNLSKYHSKKVLHSVEEENVVDRVITGLTVARDIARNAGIAKEKIILDPGIGFAKTQKENLMVLANLEKIRVSEGFPMLLAASRKSVIGNVLELDPAEREEGTLVTSVLAANAGYCMVRVHDVEKNVRALKMLEAIRNSINN